MRLCVCAAQHSFTYREVHRPSCADWWPFLRTTSRRPMSYAPSDATLPKDICLEPSSTSRRTQEMHQKNIPLGLRRRAGRLSAVIGSTYVGLCSSRSSAGDSERAAALRCSALVIILQVQTCERRSSRQVEMTHECIATSSYFRSPGLGMVVEVRCASSSAHTLTRGRKTDDGSGFHPNMFSGASLLRTSQ